jgi:hypothetical protein
MRSWWAIPGLVLALLAGCVTTHRPAPSPPPARRADRPMVADATAQDLVLIDIAVLERPVGDHYVNVRLWDAADEQVIPPERRAVVEDNGFRVGMIGGTLPAELQDILGSKRSCPDPRRIQTHAGNATTLTFGTSLPLCQFDLHDDDKVTAVRLPQADCILRVTPTFSDGGRTRLQVVPEVLHGDTALLPRPAADRSGWELHQHRAAEPYTVSAWDVTLAPGQYLVVGARFDRPDTLGQRTFIHGEPNPVQYLLILRASRMQVSGIAGAAENEDRISQAPSLARQVGPALALPHQ